MNLISLLVHQHLIWRILLIKCKHVMLRIGFSPLSLFACWLWRYPNMIRFNSCDIIVLHTDCCKTLWNIGITCLSVISRTFFVSLVQEEPVLHLTKFCSAYASVDLISLRQNNTFSFGWTIQREYKHNIWKTFGCRTCFILSKPSICFDFEIMNKQWTLKNNGDLKTQIWFWF